MKTILTTLLTMIFLLLGNQLFGKDNFKGDTIRVQMQGLLLEVASPDLKVKNLQQADIPQKVGFLLKQLENVEINQPKINERVWVKVADQYSYGKSIYKNFELENVEINSSKTVLFNDAKLIKEQGAYVFEIESQDYLIRVYLNKLEDATKVLDAGFSEKLKLADQQIPENRKLTNGWLVMGQGQEFKSYFLGETSHITSDMIELTGGIGAGLVKKYFCH